MLRMSLIMAKMRMLLMLGMLGMISLTKVMPHICVLSSAPFQILLAFYFLYQMVRLTKLCKITLIDQIMHQIVGLAICSYHLECALCTRSS